MAVTPSLDYQLSKIIVQGNKSNEMDLYITTNTQYCFNSAATL